MNATRVLTWEYSARLCGWGTNSATEHWLVCHANHLIENGIVLDKGLLGVRKSLHEDGDRRNFLTVRGAGRIIPPNALNFTGMRGKHRPSGR